MSISISDAISQLREELRSAILDGQDQDIVFSPNSVEIELGLTFATEAKAGGGFKLLTFVDISGEGKVNRQSQHKIKLSLSVFDKEGKPLKVGTYKVPAGL